MSASDQMEQRRAPSLLPALFWSGVALAPLAALLFMVSSGGLALRLAAVLALMSVVAIGLSISLRRDPAADVERVVFDEMDALREGVRADVAAAARATHRAFGEKLQALRDELDELRAEVAASAHADASLSGQAGAIVRAEPPGRPRPADQPAVRQHGYAGADAGARPGEYRAAVRLPSPNGHPDGPGRNGHGDHGHGAGGRAQVPAGFVRHTETVRVTRQTVVGQREDEHSGVYRTADRSAGRPPEPVSPAGRGRRSAEPSAHSWGPAEPSWAPSAHSWAPAEQSWAPAPPRQLPAEDRYRSDGWQSGYGDDDGYADGPTNTGWRAGPQESQRWDPLDAEWDPRSYDEQRDDPPRTGYPPTAFDGQWR